MRRARPNHGFSLPEVLVALAVFGFTGIALTSLLVLNVRTNREAKEKTVATSIALSRIESFRAPLSAPPTVGSNMSDGTATVDGLTYTRTLSVSTSSLPAGLALVTVRVAWREPELPGLTLSSYVTY